MKASSRLKKLSKLVKVGDKVFCNKTCITWNMGGQTMATDPKFIALCERLTKNSLNVNKNKPFKLIVVILIWKSLKRDAEATRTHDNRRSYIWVCACQSRVSRWFVTLLSSSCYRYFISESCLNPSAALRDLASKIMWFFCLLMRSYLAYQSVS